MIIACAHRFIIVVIVSILIFPSLGATQTTSKAKINLTIYVEPPIIDSVHMMPDVIYHDSMVSCKATVSNKNQQSVAFTYSWFRNDEFIGIGEYYSGALDDEDSISCVANAMIGNVYGVPRSIDKKVSAVPLLIELKQAALHTLGVSKSSNEVSGSAITGMVVREVESRNISVIDRLLLGLLIVILLITIYLFVTLFRKPTIPTSD